VAGPESLAQEFTFIGAVHMIDLLLEVWGGKELCDDLPVTGCKIRAIGPFEVVCGHIYTLKKIEEHVPVLTLRQSRVRGRKGFRKCGGRGGDLGTMEWFPLSYNFHDSRIFYDIEVMVDVVDIHRRVKMPFDEAPSRL
jgi:hypothetical protein